MATNETTEERSSKLTYSPIKIEGDLEQDGSLNIFYLVGSNYGVAEKGMEITKVNVCSKKHDFLDPAYRYWVHRYQFQRDNKGKIMGQAMRNTERLSGYDLESTLKKLIQEVKTQREKEIKVNTQHFYLIDRRDKEHEVTLSWWSGEK